MLDMLTSIDCGVHIGKVCRFRVIRIYRSYSENNRRIIQYSYYCNSNSFCTVTSISYGYVISKTWIVMFVKYFNVLKANYRFIIVKYGITTLTYYVPYYNCLIVSLYVIWLRIVSTFDNLNTLLIFKLLFLSSS